MTSSAWKPLKTKRAAEIVGLDVIDWVRSELISTLRTEGGRHGKVVTLRQDREEYYFVGATMRRLG